jgi:hypothetical protein
LGVSVCKYGETEYRGMHSVCRRFHWSETTSQFSTCEKGDVRHAVEEERDEKWEREKDVGKLGECPIGEETDVPVGTLDVSVDRRYEVIAPRWW